MPIDAKEIHHVDTRPVRLAEATNKVAGRKIILTQFHTTNRGGLVSVRSGLTAFMFIPYIRYGNSWPNYLGPDNSLRWLLIAENFPRMDLVSGLLLRSRTNSCLPGVPQY